jgi:PadR family transcriptional regulator PadR
VTKGTPRFHVEEELTSPALGEWTSQLRRGVLELCILRLLAVGPSYGYEIVAALNQYQPLAAGENTLYPLLRRLKADGLLTTFTRDSPSGPPRQYYRVTQHGLARLDAIEREWAAMTDAVKHCGRKGMKQSEVVGGRR